MKKIVKIAIILLGVFVVVVPLFYYEIGSFSPDGMIEGKVTIGPFCPVEPPSGCPPPPGTYTSRQIVLTPDFGKKIFIPLNETGHFTARVKSGTYELNLTNCTFLGCEYSQPITVDIKPNQLTRVSIEIDTGIR